MKKWRVSPRATWPIPPSPPALCGMVARRKASGLPPLTFAAVFGFSSHTYLLCEWLAKAALVLGSDIRFEVVPPPQTVEALTSGRVDGFCAGAPWNAAAVSAGIGAMVHTGTDIRRDCPDKVLAWQADDFERRPRRRRQAHRRPAARERLGLRPGQYPPLRQTPLSPRPAGSAGGHPGAGPAPSAFCRAAGARPARSAASSASTARRSGRSRTMPTGFWPAWRAPGRSSARPA